MSVMDLEHLSSAYPKQAGLHPSYGTAGFRSEASLLPSTVFRCGLLTAVRARLLGKCCGLMITASHNPEQDNGVKIVEPDGEMLAAAWEPLATELACAEDDHTVAQLVQRLLASAPEHSAPDAASPPSCQVSVMLGYDTRPSAAGLVAAARAGVEAMGVTVIDLGAVSTPQLHFQVVALNTGLLALPASPTPTSNPSARCSAPSLDLYFSTLLNAFCELVASLGPAGAAPQESGVIPASPVTLVAPVAPLGTPVILHVDCANGVGAAQLAVAAQWLKACGCGLTLSLVNVGGAAGSHCGLNHQCGADFVQKELVAPQGFEGLPAGARCCSVDGDADRLVYFVLHPEPAVAGPRPVTLLDGDKIAALGACLVRALLRGLPQDLAEGVQVGVVQTAYANGASTHYLQHDLGLQVVCTKTGVKHLHPAAHAYDVGIYFEANGHGTVLFKPSLVDRLQQVVAAGGQGAEAASQLLLLRRCVNQAVGDALSGVLLVEAALRQQGWSIDQWLNIYQDLPSKQTKLVVKDRYVLLSDDPAERRVCAPAGLQEAVDAAVAEAGPQARAFVRASGTEDAVRVYAEASTRALADALAQQVAQAVFDLAGGVGTSPQ